MKLMYKLIFSFNKLFNLTLLFVLIATNSCSNFYENNKQSISVPNKSSRNIASEKKSNIVTIIPTVKVVDLCGKKFSSIQWESSDNRFIINTKFVSPKNSILSYQVPNFIVSSVKNLNPLNFELANQNITLQYPLLPSFPIDSDNLIIPFKSKTCDFLEKNYSQINSSSLMLLSKTDQFSFEMRQNGLNIRLYQNQLIKNSSLRFFESDGSRVNKNINLSLVIYYDPLYEQEMINLKNILENNNFTNITLQSVYNLPGIDIKTFVPECQGAYESECYVSSNIKNEYLNSDFIPTLYGVYWDKKTNLTSPLKYPYIPGLIRANIRKLKGQGKITHALLVGSGRVLSPFYVNETHYHSYVPQMPSGFIHTDLYYNLPDKPLKRIDEKIHFESYTAWLWSCRNLKTDKIKLRKWCEENEARFWPDPPLSAYRFGAYAPRSIIFEYEDLTSSFFKNITINDFVSVGRIPTQDKLMKTKDNIVSNYVEKVQLWFENLPEMKNNSIATYGGSTGDTWIFTQQDSTTFKSVYGAESKIYASEFFVPLSYCSGCEYMNGDNILTEMSAMSSRVAWLLNGHGSSNRIQAPYANGDVSSHFSVENKYAIDGYEIKKKVYKYPEDQSFKIIEESETLIGHVFANSCSASDFNMTEGSEIDSIMYKLHQGNQRSWAEQLIGLKRSGAMNTVVNSDVGWSYSDNAFNQYLMNAVDYTWQNCEGYIGDAYNLAILNIIKSKQLKFQIYNRQFLGLPLNPIAIRPSICSNGTGG